MIQSKNIFILWLLTVILSLFNIQPLYSADIAVLEVKIISKAGFPLKETLILIQCKKEAIDLDGKITDENGVVEFKVQKNNDCYVRGGLHGYRQAENRISIGVLDRYNLDLMQDITLEEYNRHLENPE